ncbi:hypothetical protein AYO44_06805 [Planctomycetaceae bacterium SCGC AG-212-F19]|nr:hypothetical protein AYO44_06805 [Planctomycetaceae bacterium SCGC AG-212-F19]
MVLTFTRLFLFSTVLLLSSAPLSETVRGQEQPPPARTDLYGDPLPVGALQRLGTVRLRLEKYGEMHFILPDGKTVAVSSSRHLSLLDLATGKEVRKFDDHSAYISCLSLSRDGRQIAGCGNDSTIRLWDVATGKEVRRIVSQARNVRCARFSPDGKMLATGDGDKNVVLWDTATGEELRQFAPGDRCTVFSLDFSPDGKTLAVSSSATAVKHQNGWSLDKVCLLDVATGKDLRVGRFHVPAFQVAFSPDGQTLMAVEPINGGKPDSTIHLWDVASWNHRALPAQPDRVNKAVFSPDSKTLASGSDRQTCLWDVATGKRLPPFQGKYLPASSLLFAPDGKTLVTSNGYTMRFWDAVTGEERTPVQAGHQAEVAALAMQADGRTLATAGRDQTLRLWDMATSKEVRAAQPLEYAPYPKYAFSSDGKSLAWCADKKTVPIWDVLAGKEVRRVPLPGSCFAFAPDGMTLAIGSRMDQPLRLWDLLTGKEQLSFDHRRYYDSSLAYAPSGEYLVALVEAKGADGMMSLVLWDATRGHKLRQWGDSETSGPFLFSSDSRLLVHHSWPTTLVLWELAAGKERFRFEVPKNAQHLAFSHDGKLLAVGTFDKAVYVYDVATGGELASFQGHRGGITALGFAHEDKVLASGSADTTVVLWDVAALHRNLAPAQTPLTAQALDAFWNDLATDGGKRVQLAIGALAGVPKQSEPLIKERLKLPQPVDPQRLRRRITDLDAELFAVREQATAELEKLAELAAPALETTLKGKPSLETRQRIETILGKLTVAGTPAPEVLRGLRAVEVLERIGSPEARQQLEAFARTEPPSRVSKNAQAALQRLAARPAQR